MLPLAERFNQYLKKFVAFPRWLQGAILLGTMGILALGSFLLQPSVTPGPVEDPFANSTGLALDVFFKLILVVGLIFIASIILRRMKGEKGIKSTRQMALKESITLAPRRNLHLVEVNGRKFMIGSTDQAVNLIAEVSEVENPVLESNFVSAPVDEFKNLLSSTIKQKGV